MADGLNFQEKISVKVLKRNDDAHKGECGRICVIAGSRNMTGAALLCAEASLRSGAGLVYMTVPGSILNVCQSSLREAVFFPAGNENDLFFAEKYAEKVAEKALSCDAAVIGPGIGRDSETIGFVLNFLKIYAENACETNNNGLLIDADGLFALSKIPEKERKELREYFDNGKTVITPHCGEASVLLGMSPQEISADREAAVKKLYEEYGAVSLLKGKNTLVFGGNGKFYENNTGNSGMATAGSGDVLSGIISTFLARTDAFEAACAGAYLHGLTGDYLKEMFGKSYFTSGDMVKYLYKPLKQYEV